MAFKDQFEEKSLHWVQLPGCYFMLITLWMFYCFYANYVFFMHLIGNHFK